MKLKPLQYLLTLPILYMLLSMLISPGCANIVPPVGGPKDSFPPILLKATPENNSNRFAAKTITLEFDEFVQLDNVQQQLIINPPANKQPDIIAKLRTITIKVKDTLQPNTTYSFRFGAAIKDINEGNPMQDFSYVFSTGSYIDSLTLSGTVFDAETGQPDSTLIVLLHQNPDDSAVAKEKPRYITRPNGKGHFLFENLPGGQFFLFALKDEGFRRYGSNRTPFAFHGPAIRIGAANDSIVLRAFVGEKEPEKKASAQPTGIGPGGTGKKRDEKQQLRISVGANENQPQDLLSPLMFNFSQPIKSFDSSKLLFSDTNNVPIRDYTLQLDTSATKMELRYAWKDDSFYKVLIRKDFITDSADIGNPRPDTIVFKSKAESEYGAVKLSFNGVDLTKRPLLQWVQNNVVVKSSPLSGNRLAIPLIQPGEYQLRILYDDNGNGQWDTGNYWKKKQPEEVIAVKQKISIRANWDNEIDVNL